MAELVQPAGLESVRDLLQVKAPSDIVEWINSMIYGEPGSGKTHFCGTADDDERTRPVLIFDVEGGLATLRKRPGIDVLPVRSMKDLQEGYNKLYKSQVNGRLYYKTTCVDSLSELTALDMKTIMQDAYQRDPDKIDPDVPAPRHWGKAREHIRTIVRAFRDLPCHVVMTCALGTMTEEATNITKYFPALAGKLRADVPGFVDIVGYLYAESIMQGGKQTKNRFLQVASTRRVMAKDRTSALGDVVKDPTIPLIWDMIHSTNLS